MTTKEQRSRFVAKKTAVLALLTGLSLITFLIEGLFPTLIIPGAKPGLANVFSFAALIMYSPIEAFIVVALRTVLGAVYAGNVSALLYSFSGGIVSMAVSSVLMYIAYPKISVFAVSVAAAVAHNVTFGVGADVRQPALSGAFGHNRRRGSRRHYNAVG